MNLPSAPLPLVTIEEFQKLALRVGTVISARDHPQADHLLVLQVDLGGETRQLVAGIKGFYQPTAVVGKQVVVLVNLQPALIRGIESQGMVLAAKDPTTVSLLTLERPVQAGSPVT